MPKKIIFPKSSICPKIIQEWFKSSLNGFNRFGVGVDSSLTSGDMLEDTVAVVCVVFTYKEASAESRYSSSIENLPLPLPW